MLAGAQELPQLPDLILRNGDPGSQSLLKPEGIFVFEHGKQYDFSSHPCFIDHRAYGSVNFTLFASSPRG